MSAPDAITVFLCPTEVYDDYVGTAFRFGHVQAGRPDRGSAYLRATPELLALIEAAAKYDQTLAAGFGHGAARLNLTQAALNYARYAAMIQAIPKVTP